MPSNITNVHQNVVLVVVGIKISLSHHLLQHTLYAVLFTVLMTVTRRSQLLYHHCHQLSRTTYCTVHGADSMLVCPLLVVDGKWFPIKVCSCIKAVLSIYSNILKRLTR